MQTITSPPVSYCCFGNRTNLTTTNLRFKKSLPKNTQTHFRATITLSQAHSRSKEQHRAHGKITETDPYPNYHLILHFFSYNRPETSDNRIQEPQNRGEEGEEGERQLEKRSGLFATMWWADFKAALGQRFNSGAILCSVRVVLKDRSLALPHVSVRDISRVDWSELKRRGFEGVVFDKDNTITAPYSLRLWGPLAPSLEQCKAVFGPNIAVFSNSAGLFEYDHDGSKARALESSIGIKVIRHRVKKPAGTAEEIEKHFGCDASQLIMVGDRPLTDIVYGNMNGFLTILTGPLTLTAEPFIVRQVRKLEKAMVKRWSSEGLNPTAHKLLPDASQCVIDPSIG